MSLETDILKLRELNSEITAAKERYKTAKQQFIEKYHPLKVGDITTVTGCAYTGQKMVVTHVSMEHHDNTTSGITCPRSQYWWADGNVLKKDGTPGKNEGRWTQQI